MMGFSIYLWSRKRALVVDNKLPTFLVHFECFVCQGTIGGFAILFLLVLLWASLSRLFLATSRSPRATTAPVVQKEAYYTYR